MNRRAAGAEAAAARISTLRRELQALTAPQRLGAWRSGELPMLPVMDLLGITPGASGPDGAAAELAIRPDLLDQRGRLPAGLLAMLADVITGWSIVAALEVPARFVTVSLTVEVLVDPLPVAGTLHGRASRAGRRGALHHAAGDITAADGTVVARCSGWHLAGPMPQPIAPPDGGGGGDPEAAPGLAAASAVEGVTGISGVVGLRPFRRAGDGVVAELPVGPELMNLGLVLHGGVGALVADLVAAAALPEAFTTVSSTYSYLRPAGAGGQPVLATARMLRRGRAVGTAEADVVAADGRTAVHAVITAAPSASAP